MNILFKNKKRLGQNFLINEKIQQKICSLTKIENEEVLEVGPGKGYLTKYILKQNPSRLILIEKDCSLQPFLSKIVDKKKQCVELIFDDILKIPIFKLSNKNLKLPFQNNYETLNSLGQDRLALVSSAILSYPQTNTLIIDIGSCITYDFVDSKNIYHGGAISPGFNLRYLSLNDHTSNLPLLEFKEIDTLIGSNTEDSIHSGIYNGVIAEINDHIEKLFIDYNDLKVVITGGSSKFLLNRIKNAIFADQDFIAVGLNYIINYNENR